MEATANVLIFMGVMALFVCALALVASLLPPLARAMQGRGISRRRVGLAAAGAFGLAVIGGALAPNQPESKQAPAAQIAAAAAPRARMPATPVLTIGAYDLARAYENNAVAADQRFKGKVLEVEGRVAGVDRDITNTIYVMLGSGYPDEVASVQLFFPDSSASEIAKLMKQDPLAARCKCDGKALMNVILTGCVITVRPER